MENEIIIDAKEIIKKYSGEEVVNISSLEIPKGQQVGLVGNNGAGKTTFFRMILDLVKPDKGEIRLKSFNVRQKEEWKSFTGSYLDENFLISFLTPDEYFLFISRVNNIPNEKAENFLNSFGAFFNDEIRGKKKFIRNLSQGNKKKVGIAAALMTEPEIIILDEPFANLDPSTQIRLKRLIKEKTEKERITSFISSHDLNHVIEVCDRILILEKGRIVRDILTSETTLSDLELYFENQIAGNES